MKDIHPAIKALALFGLLSLIAAPMLLGGSVVETPGPLDSQPDTVIGE